MSQHYDDGSPKWETKEYPYQIRFGNTFERGFFYVSYTNRKGGVYEITINRNTYDDEWYCSPDDAKTAAEWHLLERSEEHKDFNMYDQTTLTELSNTINYEEKEKGIIVFLDKMVYKFGDMLFKFEYVK